MADGASGDGASSTGEVVPTGGVFATADLYDDHGDALQSCSLQLRSIGGATRFQGGVSTVRCYRDNALVKAALAEPG